MKIILLLVIVAGALILADRHPGTKWLAARIGILAARCRYPHDPCRRNRREAEWGSLGDEEHALQLLANSLWLLVAYALPSSAANGIAFLVRRRSATILREMGTGVPGRPVTQWDPHELGVHLAIAGGSLPTYVPRTHDALVRAALVPEVAASRLVVLQGGPATGKTRGVWEALLDQVPGWDLNYPHNLAALRERLDNGVAPGTVLWLGELRQYANADGGEEVLDRLSGLLEGSEHLLIVTTGWPEDLAAYAAAAHSEATAAPAYAAAGRLLKRLPNLTGRSPAEVDPTRGGVINVPCTFTAAEMQTAAISGDPVLAAAAAAAAAAGQPGQVTQYLSGIPDLLERYYGLQVHPYGQAVIAAAMDAARLGHACPLPAALLSEAAVGYLTAEDRAHAPNDWQDQALEWASLRLRGSVRALLPVPNAHGPGIAGYQVAGYLEQHGRTVRHGQPGPTTLWDALTARTVSAADLTRIAQSAQELGFHQYASALLAKAADQGSTDVDANEGQPGSPGDAPS